MKAVIDCIGNTQLIQLSKIYKGPGKLFAKAEFTNPGGSIKDRAAKQVIEDALQNNILKPGQRVVEMTSGNMGAGLAVVCAFYDLPFTAVMPAGNSDERKKILEALGAEVITVPYSDGIKEMVTGEDVAAAAKYAREFALEKNAYYVDQFNNPSCIAAHYRYTAAEIRLALQNEINAFACSIGSGATFIGISKRLKAEDPRVKCIAIEPFTAAIFGKGIIEDPRHIIQGTGYGIIPPHWSENLADEFIGVEDDEALEFTHRLAKEEGLFVGYSSGANVCGAIKFMEKSGEEQNVVTLLCDTGFKY